MNSDDLEIPRGMMFAVHTAVQSKPDLNKVIFNVIYDFSATILFFFFVFGRSYCFVGVFIFLF